MSRYTAIRTALISSAVLKPLLAMTGFLFITAKVDTTYLLIVMVCFFLVSILPGLCADPSLEDEQEKRASDAGIFGYIRPICLYLVAYWLFYQPEVRDFLSTVADRLWDWRPITAMSACCLLWVRRDLRFALNFKASDLYPHVKRTEKREVP